MSAFWYPAKAMIIECKLSEIAKEFPNKSLDYRELDKPILNTSDTKEKEGFSDKGNQNRSLDYRELDKPILIANEANEKEVLSNEEKQIIKDEKGWPDDIINSIQNMDEYDNVYKDAGLLKSEVNGKICLIKKNLDFDYVSLNRDGEPVTNRELMEQGKSPINAKTGEKIELHHMGQDYNSPLAELTENSEHGGKNHGLLHNNRQESWRGDSALNNQYNNHDRPDHWKARANEGGNN